MLDEVEIWEADRVRSILAREAGDYIAAVDWLEQGLRRTDHDWACAMLLANLAQLALARGEVELGQRQIDDALVRITRSGEPRTLVLVTYTAATLARDQGQLHEAHRGFERAEVAARQDGFAWYVATASLGVVSTLLELDDLDAASGALARASRAVDEVDSLTLSGVTTWYRACLALLQGRDEDALAAAMGAATLLRRANQSVQLAIALSFASLAALRLGRAPRAARLLGQARRAAGGAVDAQAIVGVMAAVASGEGPDTSHVASSDLRLARRCAACDPERGM